MKIIKTLLLLLLVSVLFLIGYTLVLELQTDHLDSDEKPARHSLDVALGNDGEYHIFSIAENHPYYTLSVKNTSDSLLKIDIERDLGRQLENTLWFPPHPTTSVGLTSDIVWGATGKTRKITVQGTNGGDVSGHLQVEATTAPPPSSKLLSGQ